MPATKRSYNSPYSGEHLNRVAFPLGGIGAGMICLEGSGALSHVSLRGHPDVFHEPQVFAALCIKGQPNVARVLEGPVPGWKVFFPWGARFSGAGNGGPGKTYGLPRCAQAEFVARFPFAHITLDDPSLPLAVQVTGWSPFTPGDAARSSLPVAALEYRFSNRSGEAVEAVYSFHAQNFMAPHFREGRRVEQRLDAVLATTNGFVLWQAGSEGHPWGARAPAPMHALLRPWEQGACSVVADDPTVKVNCAWFRGGWFDPLTMVWKAVQEGAAPEAGPIAAGNPSSGGSLFIPFRLGPGEEKTVRLRLAWHVPETDIRQGRDQAADQPCCTGGCACEEPQPRHRPWYAGVFADIEAVTQHWRREYDALRQESARFADCFHDTTLPPEVVEAVAANLTILKSPTVLRQTDGRLWCWEGCHDSEGCCPGSCTHVWNYAQALPHLFPDLERSLRQTEFGENQEESGHQAFRASLPIRPVAHDFHAAADGQLGGIMKVYREWRISGDGDWLRRLWPKVRRSLEYCIETWDPAHKGVLEEPHHNTYDIEFWGPDGMCTSIYLGALQAGIAMAEAVGDEAPLWRELLARGRAAMETDLWDGEYFIQRIQWEGLRAGDPASLASMVGSYSPEALQLLRQEGPKYQYGSGCLSDGVLGAWMAAVCGLGEILDAEKATSHLLSVHRYNLRHDLSEHANPQRPTYALGKEGGLLLCSWPQGRSRAFTGGVTCAPQGRSRAFTGGVTCAPKGGALSLPFVYSNEVWTGIEYQVASHLMMLGQVEEGLEIVRIARDRYDGRVRNPFNEIECGHWYARAMASYALLQGLSGARYDAVEQTLYLQPRLHGDFRSFLSTATGYGTVGVLDGKPFVEVRHGTMPYQKLVYEPCR